MSQNCIHCALPVPSGRAQFCCFGCRFAYEAARPVTDDAEGETPAPGGTLLLRLGLSIFLALNVMVASWFSYSQEIFGSAAEAQGAYAVLPSLFSYAAFFLCTIILALLGVHLLGDALQNLFRKRIDAQLLIVVGVFSAYILSAINTFRGEGSLYYDTTAVVLVIVSLGSYLEAGAKQRAASSASALLTHLPSQLQVEKDGTTREVAAADVQPGDVIVVRPGEVVGVDGEVLSGDSHLDEASLTGESRPRSAGLGDRVLAGSVSLDGQLKVRAEEVGDGRVLALVERSLAAARAQQPAIQRLADRVAAVFVPTVVVLALVVFARRAVAGDAAGGILQGLSVLLISCPCALGLAAPLATWHALRRAAEKGVLIDSPVTLERAAAVRHAFFDKTGTLTRPEPDLETIATSEGMTAREALELAASLETASTHPIARALVEHARQSGLELRTPEEARNVPGLGVEGTVDGRRLRLGGPRWVSQVGAEGASRVPQDDRAVFLMEDGTVLARFALTEEPREDAATALAQLQEMGIEVAVLSGDRETATAQLSERLGLPATGGLLPEQKVEILTAARTEKKNTIAMIGDGLNDAPVLAAADVGIAVGSASDLAKSSGNVRLMTDRLQRVPFVLALARETRRRIQANLIWAFGFNSVGIGLAAAGRLTPVFAAIAMVFSSLMVVRISSRRFAAHE